METRHKNFEHLASAALIGQSTPVPGYKPQGIPISKLSGRLSPMYGPGFTVLYRAKQRSTPINASPTNVGTKQDNTMPSTNHKHETNRAMSGDNEKRWVICSMPEPFGPVRAGPMATNAHKLAGSHSFTTLMSMKLPNNFGNWIVLVIACNRCHGRE